MKAHNHGSEADLRPPSTSAAGNQPLWVALLGLFCLTTASRAQTYAIDWFTVAGGGGTSTGGVHSVSGTLGQWSAGNLSGGRFNVVSGFWSIVAAVQTPGAPRLSLTRPTPGTVALSWPSPSALFVLQQNPDAATTNWVDVSPQPSDNGTNKIVTVTSPVGNRFYRLRKP